MKVVLETFASKVLRIAVPTHRYIWVGGYLHDRSDSWKRSALAVNFQAYLLAEIRGKCAKFVERFADLLDGFLMRHSGRQIIGFHFGAASADCMTQLDKI